MDAPRGGGAGPPPRARVVVAGAGAVGSVFGGLLAARGHEVLLAGRDPHMAAIARDGLRVHGIFGETISRPAVTTDLAAAASAADLVLVAVKSHATAAVADTLARWSPRPQLVVSLQNGLGNVEVLGAALGDGRVLGARVIFGAVVTRPGEVLVTVNARPVAIGPLRADARATARAGAVAALVADAGIPCEAVAATEPLLWEKALYNCGLNPIGALHGLTYGEVAAEPARRAELDAAIREGFAVARASGIGLPWPDAGAFLRHFHGNLLPPTAAHRSSMSQDLAAGRPTEIEAICGAIARAGARAGVATPVNDRLVAAIHAAERDGAARR